ncbi:MAG TPA: glycosyltransferase [Firmicutes bacterium]|nr:glycosyltransferase [Bacillota bacterium]
MKIMHLISGGETGGSKTHVLTLVQELQKQADVTLMCLMAGAFYAEGKAMGLDIRTLEQKKRYHLHAVRELGRLLTEEGYSLLHCHGPRANFIGALVKKFYRIPTLTTIHSDFLRDFEHNYYKNKVYTTLNTLALKTFDGYLAVSEDFKNMLVARGFPAEKITVIYNGIDFAAPVKTVTRAEFCRQYNLSLPGEAKVVGILARLHPIKGHEVFLQGARLIAEAEPATHFLLGGDGEERQKLTALRDKLGLTERVHFAGHVSEPPAFMQAIDINTLTSHSESFPYVLLEGALLRKPAVSSQVGGIAKLITHEKTGMLFPPGDAAAFAAHTLTLLRDSALAKKMGDKLYHHAKANYSLAGLADAHLQVYQHYGKGMK